MPAPSSTGNFMGQPSSVDSGGIAPWSIVEEGMAPQGTSHVLTTNQVYLWGFETNVAITIDVLYWKMAATATGTTDIGVYDASGNLLTHSGATANSANANNSVTLTNALSLGPGRYMLGLCPSNGTDTYIDINAAGSGLIRTMGCANAGTAGVLPATTGALSAAGNTPIMRAHIVGGAP